MDFKNFVIDHIDRVLEYLKQNPLIIYTRRSVDAYLATYALIEAFGETAQLSVVDWPPKSGICIGFKCEGMYITEREVGIDNDRYNVEFTSISHLVAIIIQSLSPLEEHIHRALYAGHYSWSVDYCEYKCPIPKELLKGDEKLAIVFPFLDTLPVEKALSLSTLPILPGITGRGAENSKSIASMSSEEAVSLLDRALGVVYNEGFHTAVFDKAIKPYSFTYKPADIAIRIEADLAGFINRDISVYVSNLAETFYLLLKKIKDSVITIQNPFYIYKIPPYLSYYMKLTEWIILKYETTRGFILAVIPPMNKRDMLKNFANVLSEIGQTLVFPTHFIAYIESDKYADFLKIYEEVNK